MSYIFLIIASYVVVKGVKAFAGMDRNCGMPPAVAGVGRVLTRILTRR